MVSQKDAVQLWEDHVGDSGHAPTDEELHKFAQAVEERTRKPFVKLHKKWKRKEKEYRTYALNHIGWPSRSQLYQTVSDDYNNFAHKLKNRLDAKN
jgi:hypothetical protein